MNLRQRQMEHNKIYTPEGEKRPTIRYKDMYYNKSIIISHHRYSNGKEIECDIKLIGFDGGWVNVSININMPEKKGYIDLWVLDPSIKKYIWQEKLKEFKIRHMKLYSQNKSKYNFNSDLEISVEGYLKDKGWKILGWKKIFNNLE